MRVYDPSAASSLWVYRSERIPSLYAADVSMYYDADRDGVLDNVDNCTLAANANQRDTNADGFGNVCDADVNNDGTVEYTDLFYLQQLFESSNPDADLDGDGVVSWPDLERMIDGFFAPPGPSGLLPRP